MTGIRTSVVICVLDDWRILRLLRSLEQQTASRDSFEVIVVTTGIERYDDLFDRFDLHIKTEHSPVSRLSIQRNIGLDLAEGEYYLTTDADCVAEPRWVEEMTRSLNLADREIVAVGGAIRKYSHNSLVQRHGITIDDGQNDLNYLPALNLPYVTGANSGYRTLAVRDLGGYDERFLCGDDVDISYRLGLAGGRLALAPDAVILHEDRETLVAHFRRFSYYAVDQALLFKKYRHISGARWKFNGYPWRRMSYAVAATAKGAYPAVRGEWAQIGLATVTAAEATGVLAGDLRGSAKHRVLYV